MSSITRVNTLKTEAEFHDYLQKVGAQIPFDEQLSPGHTSPLGKPFVAGNKTVGNRSAQPVRNNQKASVTPVLPKSTIDLSQLNEIERELEENLEEELEIEKIKAQELKKK